MGSGGLFNSSPWSMGDRGIVGKFYDDLMGAPPKAKPSGIFAGAPQLGQEFNSYLMSLLTQDVTDSRQFDLMSEAMREGVDREAASSKARLGDAALSGGFMDSGAIPAGFSDIERSRIGAYAGGLRDIELGLEEQRISQLDMIFPFLSGASSESVAIQELIQNSLLGRQKEDRLHAGQMSSEAREWVSLFGGGGGMGMGG